MKQVRLGTWRRTDYINRIRPFNLTYNYMEDFRKAGDLELKLGAKA